MQKHTNVFIHNTCLPKCCDLILTGIYVELTDHVGHQYGPKSNEIKQAVQDIDFEIHRLLGSLQTTEMADGSGKMSDFVNVMVVSDHGMAYASQIINITKIIEKSMLVEFDDIKLYLTEGGSPFKMLWPVEDKIEAVRFSFISLYAVTSFPILCLT